MRIFTRLLEKLYRVATKHRCASTIVGAAALATLSLGVSEPAVAACLPDDDNNKSVEHGADLKPPDKD